jgi:hypothetical protein
MLKSPPLNHDTTSQVDLVQRDGKEFEMTLTVAHITPLIALLAGILILIVPSLLNYIVAIYLIVVGVVGLNEINHFIN